MFGDFGRTWINFKDLGVKEKYFQVPEEISFMDYFQGSREHRPPGGPLPWVRDSSLG